MAQIRKKGKAAQFYVSLSIGPSCDSVLYGIIVLILVWPGLRCWSESIEKKEVVMQIIIPYEASAEKDLQRTHLIEKSTINHSPKSDYNNLRKYFTVDTWLNFTHTQSPGEIQELFCLDVFNKQVNILLVMKHGIAVDSSNDYILNLAEHLGYPVISWDPQYPGALESVSTSRVLQIAPTLYHQCQAMIKVLNRYNWTEFSIVTTKVASSNDFVSCMKAMVSKSATKHGFTTTNKYTIITVEEIDLSMYDDPSTIISKVQASLKQLKRTDTRIILLHAEQTHASYIIEEAETLDLTSSQYQWIMTSLSKGRASKLTLFPAGVLAITYNDSREIIMNAMNTAIQVWALALDKIAERPFQLKRVSMFPRHSCNSSRSNYWRDGELLYRKMKSVTIDTSPDSTFSFAENGVVKDVELLIYNTRPFKKKIRLSRKMNAWSLVGTIKPKNKDGKTEMSIEMDEVVWPGGGVFPPKGKPDKRFFRIVTLEEPPYIAYVPPDPVTGLCTTHAVPCKLMKLENAYKNATLDKNGMVEYCCTGLCVDLLNILSERMNFDYEMYEVHDREWGIQKNNMWNGLIQEMLDKKADMVITSIKINHQRATAMDFSTPFLETGITIMVALRKGAISATAFLEPFDIPSWLMVMIVCIPIVASAIFATEYFSPMALNRGNPINTEPYDYPSWCLILVFSVHATGASIFIFEWMSPSGLNKGKTPMREHKFSLFRSFWLIWAMLFGASVSTDNPRGTSSRFLANVWALFALVFLASYTANLAAFMITIDEYYDLSGIEDWRLMNPTAVTPHFRFATKPGGSTEDNLRKNYPAMHRYMQKFNQSGVPEGIMALKSGKIHAFIYDATVMEYNAGRDKDCELITVGKWYAMTGYGVGFPKGSQYIEEVNEIILNLQKEGELDRMVKFWLAGACHAKKDKKDKSSHNIGILNFTSAFILLAAGVLLGTILLLLEHCYFKFGRKCLKKYDKTGCCSLVSLSMGKSLTFEQSVMDAIDYHRKHRCKDPLCETQLWKAKHELDLALMKITRLKEELNTLEHHSLDHRPTILAPEEESKPVEPNGNSMLHNNRCSKPDSIYEIPDSVRKRHTNHVVNLPPLGDSKSNYLSEKEKLDTGEKDIELSDVDKRRLQFRRSPSYTNAMSTDSDGKDSGGGGGGGGTRSSSTYGLAGKDSSETKLPSNYGVVEKDSEAAKAPSNYAILDKEPTSIKPSAKFGEKEFSPRRCPSYSQAVEESPMLAPQDNSDNQKHTRTRFYDGKYYVGVAGDNDESVL